MMRWVLLFAAVVVTVAGGAAATATATTAGQGQCEVLDLSMQPSRHPMPTNLTVRPSAAGWHLKFSLGEGQTPPVACVRVEEIESRVALTLYGGQCDKGTILDYSYLPRASFTPHNWTTLDMDVTSDAVLVKAPGHLSVRLSNKDITLPRDSLQVTGAQGVEAAVGCRVSCPVHHHTSEGPDVKKKVGEWQQDNLHFYFRPGPSFTRLHYEVVCKTRQDSVFNRDVEIKPRKEDAAGGWYLVELEQQERKATVRLNDRPLQDIQLPESCTASMHVIWTVGDGSFGFSCDPRGAEEPKKGEGGREDLSGVAQPSHPMHPGVSAGIAVILTLFVVAVIYSLFIIIKKKTENKSHKDEEAPQGDSATQILMKPAPPQPPVITTSLQQKEQQQDQETETPREPAPPQPHVITTSLQQKEQQQDQEETETPKEPAPPQPHVITTSLQQQEQQQDQETDTPREPAPPQPHVITASLQQQEQQQDQETETPKEPAPPQPHVITTSLQQQEQQQDQETDTPREPAPPQQQDQKTETPREPAPPEPTINTQLLQQEEQYQEETKTYWKDSSRVSASSLHSLPYKYVLLSLRELMKTRKTRIM